MVGFMYMKLHKQTLQKNVKKPTLPPPLSAVDPQTSQNTSDIKHIQKQLIELQHTVTELTS